MSNKREQSPDIIGELFGGAEPEPQPKQEKKETRKPPNKITRKPVRKKTRKQENKISSKPEEMVKTTYTLPESLLDRIAESLLQVRKLTNNRKLKKYQLVVACLELALDELDKKESQSQLVKKLKSKQ